MHKFIQIVSKYVAKLLKYRILFKDIKTYKICCQNVKKSACFEWTFVLSGDDYRVAKLQC